MLHAVRVQSTWEFDFLFCGSPGSVPSRYLNKGVCHERTFHGGAMEANAFERKGMVEQAHR